MYTALLHYLHILHMHMYMTIKKGFYLSGILFSHYKIARIFYYRKFYEVALKNATIVHDYDFFGKFRGFWSIM